MSNSDRMQELSRLFHSHPDLFELNYKNDVSYIQERFVVKGTKVLIQLFYDCRVDQVNCVYFHNNMGEGNGNEMPKDGIFDHVIHQLPKEVLKLLIFNIDLLKCNDA